MIVDKKQIIARPTKMYSNLIFIGLVELIFVPNIFYHIFCVNKGINVPILARIDNSIHIDF